MTLELRVKGTAFAILAMFYAHVQICRLHLVGEAEKRGGLREQALIRREELSCTREGERWKRSPSRKEEPGMVVRRQSSPRRESSPRKEDPVGRRENSSRHNSLVSRTSQVLSQKISLLCFSYF